MSKDEPLLANCPLETDEPSRNYARVPGYKKNTRKRQEKTRKEKKNERRRNQYARVRRYKITSTLGLLVRGDPQNEGLRGLQPRALGSKLDYFHAGITSTRLHRRNRFALLALLGNIYAVDLHVFTAKLHGSVYFSPAPQPHFMCVELKVTVLVWRCKLLG